MTDASQINRLRWRCRRGTRELDALVGWWLNARYAQADEETQRAFAELLDVQDPDLWNWLVGREAPPRADWRRIVDEIRASDRV
ncbi:succinate dehydrogenase assembly factor 2 [Tahibacter soli]|jgi:antitoxin CptB|uniref:FAD assembly factor SdhE n=1 Tax=Tahibacter soli TaxID=2983605 RepID=A0A9X4BHM8_9GAMM|nr:succinate dehydrogenase assembly factor 2 [Tahibacter soli]MDC8013061.1 succinate dehydrogenase assembly factor 2 [Tahibacter soli]HJU40976.1 succinate dehydrogenase assembly factor 2 [Tahibacter sp.]